MGANGIMGIKGVFLKIFDLIKWFGKFIGTIINSIFLTIAYFIGVGIAALIVRLQRKRMMDLGKTKKESYWIDNIVGDKPEEEYYKQY